MTVYGFGVGGGFVLGGDGRLARVTPVPFGI